MALSSSSRAGYGGWRPKAHVDALRSLLQSFVGRVHSIRLPKKVVTRAPPPRSFLGAGPRAGFVVLAEDKDAGATAGLYVRGRWHGRSQRGQWYCADAKAGEGVQNKAYQEVARREGGGRKNR
ncbi:hypothetical protein B0H16DRAFT_1453280 [Mycena metata]|uniref:Uncharacterized protein n=1 Tax=Mycena metata TaxID=1033252 RepID=A0AAD7NNG9_9AGAR|nr:hypothetical protein B0H16DRAFT_1453280 [Mycena metata]